MIWLRFSQGRQLESWTKNGAIFRLGGLNENRSASGAERYKGATLFSFNALLRIDFAQILNEAVVYQAVYPKLSGYPPQILTLRMV